jgi:hypothetical protein
VIGAQPSAFRECPAICEPASEPAIVSVLRRSREALRLLMEARQYAAEVERDIWDFAVEIDTLQQAGCTNSEFRLFVCKGYVDHAKETTLAGEEARTFQRRQRPGGLTFSRRTCFVLTDAGNRFACSVLTEPSAETPCGLVACTNLVAEPPETPKPQWDRERQELRFGDIVVKQFKVPAANQERILAAFEEEDWPVRIDDPLPPNSDQDSKRRLHDTINSLNRNQKQNLIRFVGDGSGQGIRWELVESAG